MSSVLILDDTREIREFAELALNMWDYEVLQAETLAQAQSILAQTHVDVVLCDIGLPDGNGLDVAEWIRCNRPATRVVMMTGHSDELTREYARTHGAVGFLPKPFRLDQLQTAVANALAGDYPKLASAA